MGQSESGEKKPAAAKEAAPVKAAPAKVTPAEAPKADAPPAHAAAPAAAAARAAAAALAAAAAAAAPDAPDAAAAPDAPDVPANADTLEDSGPEQMHIIAASLGIELEPGLANRANWGGCQSESLCSRIDDSSLELNFVQLADTFTQGIPGMVFGDFSNQLRALRCYAKHEKNTKTIAEYVQPTVHDAPSPTGILTASISTLSPDALEVCCTCISGEVFGKWRFQRQDALSALEVQIESKLRAKQAKFAKFFTDDSNEVRKTRKIKDYSRLTVKLEAQSAYLVLCQLKKEEKETGASLSIFGPARLKEPFMSMLIFKVRPEDDAAHEVCQKLMKKISKKFLDAVLDRLDM